MTPLILAFKDEIQNFGYNAPSIKLLSNSISSGRSNYTDEQRLKIANLFGAFLGNALIEANKLMPSTWIQSKGDIGIIFTRGDQQRVVFPINRVFRHIDEGDEYSSYVFFMAMSELLNSNSFE